MQQSARRIGDGRHDFDFYHGRWRVRNVRLRERRAPGPAVAGALHLVGDQRGQRALAAGILD